MPVTYSDHINGITVDNNRNIYYTHRTSVYRITKHTTSHQLITNTIAILLHGICWVNDNSEKGSLYISSHTLSLIIIYSLSTEKLTILDPNKQNVKTWPQLVRPVGIYVNNTGHIYVTNRHSIQKIVIHGEIIVSVERIAGSDDSGYRNGKKSLLCYPHDLIIDNNDTIYIADYVNNCIRKFSDGTMTLFAGKRKKIGCRDGPLNKCKFESLNTLAFDINGDILIGDKNSLRRLDMKRKMVTTIQKVSVIDLTTDQFGNIYINTGRRIEIINNMWRWKRFLWIAKLKEQSNYCQLTSLPKEIMCEISKYIN